MMMTSLSALLVPILVASVLVFIASSLVHMVLPWHKSDYPKMSNEDQVMDALRPLAIPPGDYIVPRPSDMKDMKSPEFLAKFARGPVFMMTVMPGGTMNMGPQLIRWFCFCVVVSIFSGFVAGSALVPGVSGSAAFHFSALTAFASYSLAYWPMSIWYHRAWSITVKQTIDGLIYACLTGAAFMWFWPK